ncbi:Outer membrane protein YfgL, lipoprotein component of the protein assembly complex (forms a complex with YaeT, YfiO, and NlpB) [hydrothermal vent metagenome]|uniref:Outer membrane protein YfgL, lipoprotein component of the protein assembly complex (Forms a complex with YaeT, YfiO, and NlpB) n=1 Tax=hydrothermal vent metagenome TaxID=652676 RepID=A0A3B0XB10_9ZZZZ
MNNNLFRYFLLLLATLFISACADDNNVDQPAELIPFTSKYYLDVTWHKSSGTGVEEQYLFLHPLILKEVAVTISRDGVLSIIGLKTGVFEQEIELDSTISAGIGGNENVWLVATRDAYVIAVDAKSRRERWRTRVPSEVLAKPAIYQDMVIIRTIDGKILSLDINSGKIRWQYQRAIPDLTLRGTSEPVIARGKIFVGLSDGRLIAISPDNGEVIWDVALSIPTGRSEIQRLVDIDGDAQLYGRVLYAASFQGRIAAIDVDRGQFLWARDFSTHTGVLLDDKALYSSDDQGHIWALDRLNGATIWKQEKLAHRKLTRPTIIGDYLAVGDFEGFVHLLSRYDGHFIARFQLGQYDDLGWELASGIIVPLIVFGEDRLVVISRGGILYVLALREHDDDF